MAGIVKLIGIAMVILGTIYLAKPQTMREGMRFWLKKGRIYWGGVIAVIAGIIFFIAAPQCVAPWFIVVIGIISVIKGVLAFVLGPKRISPLIENLIKSPSKMLRSFAVLGLVLGILIIYSA